MLGVGAAAMTTQPMAPWVNTSPNLGVTQKFMRAAAGYWKSDWVVRAAERTLSGKFSTVDWHLEDENDVEIDDEYPDKRYQAPRILLEQPQAALDPADRQTNASTRRELWSITARHMGVCGNAFWYFDRMEPVAKTPLAILYIAPWRMTPSFTKGGNLTGWVLDWSEESQSGTPLTLDEVLQFSLEPPDEGAFAPGLVASALGLIHLNRLSMEHASSVLASGGRLAGIISAKDAVSTIPDDKFQQLVRDFRTINELPDAAKRTNIIQGPIDFTRQAATLEELDLIPLMASVRDDILALWGVPYSQLGGTSAVGLSSGDVRKYDEAALWQNAIHQRLVPFTEKVQYHLLDRYTDLGITVELEIDEPEFDDDGPKFDLLQKSAGTPMRTIERRALIGLEPFNDPILDNAIWLPSDLIQVGVAPDENGQPVAMPEVVEAPTEEPAAIGQENVAKAPVSPLHGKLMRLRAKAEREHTSDLRRDLVQFLDTQKHDIASRLRANPEHVTRRPRDNEVWFGKTARWDRELSKILERPLSTMAQNVFDAINRTIPSTVKAAPAGTVERVLKRGAARVTKINERTRDAVQDYIVKGIEKGQTTLELADAIELGVLLDNGQPAFDDYRAELIARTELMDAYNGAAVESYRDAGITEVQAIDGDGDEECAARDGRIFSVDEAYDIEDHPNGTLDWVPVLPEVKAASVADVAPITIINNIPVPMREILERDDFGTVIAVRQEHV